MTLAVCKSDATRPCIGDYDIQAARTRATAGDWSFGLSSAFPAANATAKRIGEIPGVMTHGLDAISRDVPDSYPAAVSTPVYAEDEALVLVQFARQISWLVSLKKAGDRWTIHRTFTVSER